MQSSSRCESALASVPFSGILFELAHPPSLNHGVASAGFNKMKWLIKFALLLTVASVCLFGYVLCFQNGIFREFQAALLSVEWMLPACLAVWCGTFLFLTFNRKDLPLIGLLLIAIAAFFIGYAATSRETDAIILLACVTLGKGMRFALLSQKSEVRREKIESENISNLQPSTFNLQPSTFNLFLSV